MAGNSKEAKKLREEIFKAYRASSGNSLGDESATMMGKAYLRLSGGKGYILIQSKHYIISILQKILKVLAAPMCTWCTLGSALD